MYQVKFDREYKLSKKAGIAEEGFHGPNGSFLVLKYYGQSLDKFLKHNSLTPEMALDIAIKIAIELTRLHQQGIIHHDIKPQNICIYKDDDNNFHVRIIDFGLSLELQENEPEPTPIVKGTPFYLPMIELFDGQSLRHYQLDVRSFLLTCFLPKLFISLDELEAAHVHDQYLFKSGEWENKELLKPLFETVKQGEVVKDTALDISCRLILIQSGLGQAYLWEQIREDEAVKKQIFDEYQESIEEDKHDIIGSVIFGQYGIDGLWESIKDKTKLQKAICAIENFNAEDWGILSNNEQLVSILSFLRDNHITLGRDAWDNLKENKELHLMEKRVTALRNSTFEKNLSDFKLYVNSEKNSSSSTKKAAAERYIQACQKLSVAYVIHETESKQYEEAKGTAIAEYEKLNTHDDYYKRLAATVLLSCLILPAIASLDFQKNGYLFMDQTNSACAAIDNGIVTHDQDPFLFS